MSPANALVPSPLQPERLRPMCDPGTFSFKTTADLAAIDELPGQERAMDAMRFGTGIRHKGYNLFVLGKPGTGRHQSVEAFLKTMAGPAQAPEDWVYVQNFTSTHHPHALRLPPGCGLQFSKAMDELVDDLQAAIPEVFNSEEYRDRRRAIDAEFEEKQQSKFKELEERAQQQDVAVMRTPMGFALVPTSEGQIVKPEDFNKLPEEERAQIEKKISSLQTDLTQVLETLPALQKEQRKRIRELNAEQTGGIVDTSIKQIARQFEGIDPIQVRLEEVRNDLISNTELFLANAGTDDAPFPQSPIGKEEQPQYNRYRVNVIVANDDDGDRKGAPVVFEDHPTLSKLTGRIEHLARFGALITDFKMIRPGALHRANGGYLVLDARKVLTEPFAWDALKRALRGDAIKIVSAADELGLTTTISLEPEPIPLSVKVVLIGDRLLYYLLSSLDPEFAELFKVQADFEDELERTPENNQAFANLIGTIATKEKLHALDSSGVARVIDQMVRLADDAERLSLHVSALGDILREADYWSTQANRDIITGADVDKAIEEQRRRADRIEKRSREAITRDIVLIDTVGQVVGQVNGLSVLTLGGFRFGKPSRITARVRCGSGKVIDIERETKLGGPLHSKGVLILSGYVSANYALDAPMSLWASLVFEQSYGGVDGDSASSAELYALLSALAEVPIKQCFAVTGSVNQYGQVQAIGGVNEKIEGFYDVCAARGLTGEQGVLIPQANVQHLMVRPDIAKAARDGKFAIYPVETINQGLELLTSVPAGARDKNGAFPKDSVNGRVQQRLLHFAEIRQKFSDDGNDDAVLRAEG